MKVIPIYFTNDKHIGNAELDHDGFYYFQMIESAPGFWNEESLRYVADKLEKLNGDYNSQLKDYFHQDSQMSVRYRPPYFNQPSARDRELSKYM